MQTKRVKSAIFLCPVRLHQVEGDSDEETNWKSSSFGKLCVGAHFGGVVAAIRSGHRLTWPSLHCRRIWTHSFHRSHPRISIGL